MVILFVLLDPGKIGRYLFSSVSRVVNLLNGNYQGLCIDHHIALFLGMVID